MENNFPLSKTSKKCQNAEKDQNCQNHDKILVDSQIDPEALEEENNDSLKVREEKKSELADKIDDEKIKNSETFFDSLSLTEPQFE